jgi:hypothetical protein
MTGRILLETLRLVRKRQSLNGRGSLKLQPPG